MFYFGDKKIIYIILAILVLGSIFTMTTGSILSLILTLPGVLIAITFHEYAHAFVADKLGDDTPRIQGRLTLNPFAHLDPIGAVLLVFVHFGWGKPVEINPRNFSRKISMSAGEAIVSLAGPLMNFILAIVFTIISCILVKFASSFILFNQIGAIIYTLIKICISINIGLGVFNLIPLPPLDGSKILMHFLPYNAKNWMIRNQNIFYIVFLLIWITGLAGVIISPVIDFIYNIIVGGIGRLFGIL